MSERPIEKPGSLIRIGPTVWEVMGVHLGAVGQESVIHVRRLGVHESPEGPSRVPERMLRAMYGNGTATMYEPWTEGPLAIRAATPALAERESEDELRAVLSAIKAARSRIGGPGGGSVAGAAETIQHLTFAENTLARALGGER